jgi:hypothetical protein
MLAQVPPVTYSAIRSVSYAINQSGARPVCHTVIWLQTLCPRWSTHPLSFPGAVARLSPSFNSLATMYTVYIQLLLSVLRVLLFTLMSLL